MKEKFNTGREDANGCISQTKLQCTVLWKIKPTFPGLKHGQEGAFAGDRSLIYHHEYQRRWELRNKHTVLPSLQEAVCRPKQTLNCGDYWYVSARKKKMFKVCTNHCIIRKVPASPHLCTGHTSHKLPSNCWWAHNEIYRSCIIEMYIWNLYNLIKQYHPNKFNK